MSTGELLTAPRLSPQRQRHVLPLLRKLARAQRGSSRRARVKLALARLRASEADLRTNWAAKVSTDLARRFDVIRVQHLEIQNMIRSARGTISEPGRNVRAKAGLNSEIMASGLGLLVRRLEQLVRRLEQKVPGRVERINPAFTSQRCSACGHSAADSRKSQAVFACVACGFACNADVNAAINIAARQAVTARGRSPAGGRMNREPQLALLSA